MIAGYPIKEPKFNFKFTIRTVNQNVNLKYSQKRDSSLGREKPLIVNKQPSINLTIVGLKAAINKESVQAQHKKNLNSINLNNFL